MTISSPAQPAGTGEARVAAAAFGPRGVFGLAMLSDPGALGGGAQRSHRCIVQERVTWQLHGFRVNCCLSNLAGIIQMVCFDDLIICLCMAVPQAQD